MRVVFSLVDDEKRKDADNVCHVPLLWCFCQSNERITKSSGGISLRNWADHWPRCHHPRAVRTSWRTQSPALHRGQIAELVVWTGATKSATPSLADNWRKFPHLDAKAKCTTDPMTDDWTKWHHSPDDCLARWPVGRRHQRKVRLASSFFIWNKRMNLKKKANMQIIMQIHPFNQ